MTRSWKFFLTNSRSVASLLLIFFLVGGESHLLWGQGLTSYILFNRKEGAGKWRSEAVFLDEEGVAVIVTDAGVDFRSGKYNGEPVSLLAYDPVSRVGLIKVPLDAGQQTKPVELGSSLTLKPANQLYPSLEGETFSSRIVSRESEYKSEPLPFELFRVHHQADQKLFPGHPLYDSAGRLVAINYRGAGEFGNGSFAFPVEVVKRIQNATVIDSLVQRSWFGVELLASDPFASVQGVRQASPAAKAGIVKGDILLQIGPRPICCYADAINAFYYLREGEEAVVKFMRGTDLLESIVLPELVPSNPLVQPVTDSSKAEGGA